MRLGKVALLAFCFGGGLHVPAAIAQSSSQLSYPTRTVTLIVPYPAGSTDTFARMLATRLSDQWGQGVVVDNKPGGAGVIGMMAGRDATPDGYTLLLGMSGPLAGNPNLMSKLPYDPIKDYTMVAGLLVIPLMLSAHPSAPFNTLAELVDSAKKTPGKIEYGTPGNGTTNHLAGELLKSRLGIDLLHVPYKGAAPGMSDLLGGHIKLMVVGVSESLPNIKAGKLKPIAVTSRQRVPQLPDVPTVAELSPGFEGVGWGGLLAPLGTPPAIVEKIQADLRRVFADPAFTSKIVGSGLVADYRDGAAFRSYVQSEIEKLGQVVKSANVRVE